MPDWLTGHFATALICVGGFMALFFDGQTRNDSSPTKKRWQVAKIGGALAIIGGLLSAVGSGQQQGRMETLANETKALVTGGDSLVWVRLSENQQKPNTFTGRLALKGDVTVFDINIEVIPTNACDEMERWTMGNSLATGVGDPRSQFVPGFGPHTLKFLRGSFAPSCDEAYYLLLIQTRNMSTLEQIQLKKIDGKWHQAIRLQELYSGKTLLDEVDSGFVGNGEKISWPDASKTRKQIILLSGKQDG